MWELCVINSEKGPLRGIIQNGETSVLLDPHAVLKDLPMGLIELL